MSQTLDIYEEDIDIYEEDDEQTLEEIMESIDGLKLYFKAGANECLTKQSCACDCQSGTCDRVRFFVEEEKRNKILSESADDYFNIQILFPSGRRVKRKFQLESSLVDIRNFVDIYILDNEIKIENYDLVHNYPYKKFTYRDNEIPLYSTFDQKSFTLYVENLDS
jgi:hypothetical protein